MPSLLLDTETLLAYLRAPGDLSGYRDLSERAIERLAAASGEQVFVSVVSLHALRQLHRIGSITDTEWARFLEYVRPEQILPVDDETRMLAASHARVGSRLDVQLIAATARRWRLTLLSAADDYDADHYHIDVIASGRHRLASTEGAQ